MTTNILLPHPLKISASGCNEGDLVKVNNITTPGSATTTLNADKKAIIDLANISGYTVGDKIEVIIVGKQIGGATATTSGSSTTVTITTAAYGGPSVSV